MKELTTLRLFSPLTANLYTPDEYGGLSDWPDELTPADLCAYEDKIFELIQHERLDSEGDRGLAVYLHHDNLREKVYSMNPTVEVWQGKLWGVLELKSHGELSPAELESLTEEWCGQESDGWGEGFEQRPIKTNDGELYVSFWNAGKNFSIKPEQELKQPLIQSFDMQMGGM
ncbi:hypothetical protein [Sinanaerobacter chloroacetimidivorans]|uniref:Uncharacterized protein n=1 Tax=Sinanaerobacter chloroacetimidivorans TaxID=2818044 RepID=A0A8J7VZT4_9FIRM|nr:hypothetical protein [Sinanaerobacter chloroacetimidivorans]MBR0596390.1 hypothetical protein [Sinanaerobacter chloroacetimidivorans]